MALAGRPYPGAVPDPVAISVVEVLGPLTDDEMGLVDAWESEYNRIAVTVLADGDGGDGVVTGWLYALAPSSDPALQPGGPWLLSVWERVHLAASVAAAQAFRSRWVATGHATDPKV